MADKSILEGSKTSLATLPSSLEIKDSKIPNAGLGVFALNELKCNTRFGPYQGKKVRPDIPRDDIDTSYMWEVWFVCALPTLKELIFEGTNFRGFHGF